MIHVIGESHAESFNGHTTYFVTHVIPSVTAYNLVEEHSTSDSRRKVKEVVNRIHPNETLLFVFGEIDCRVHIFNKYMQNECTIPLSQYISDTVKRYMQFLKELDRKIIVANIPPAGYELNVMNFPFFGSPKDRALISKTYNLMLKQKCDTEDIPFIDIFDKVVLPNGLANPEYLRDQVHFNHKAIELMQDELRRMKLI